MFPVITDAVSKLETQESQWFKFSPRAGEDPCPSSSPQVSKAPSCSPFCSIQVFD